MMDTTVEYLLCVYVAWFNHAQIIALPKFIKLYEKVPNMCNIFPFIKQFAKRLLQGTSVTEELVLGYEGMTIAAKILDVSDSLQDLCAKCG